MRDNAMLLALMINWLVFLSWKFFLLPFATHCVHAQSFTNYYSTYTSYGTQQGDTIIQTFLQYKGFTAPHHRWLVECQDQEAMYGIFDFDRDFLGILKVWCKNVFPLKSPSLGTYPYYPKCFVREAFLAKEFYCFDQRAPEFTANSFMTAVYEPTGPRYLFLNFKQKCCTAPPGYYVQYPLCYYKYTHDQWGEHFDGEWLVTCDAPNHVITGMAHAINPWDEQLHVVWILCCPIVFSPTVPILFLPTPPVMPLAAVQHAPDVVYGYGSYTNGTQGAAHTAYGPSYRVLHANTLNSADDDTQWARLDPLQAPLVVGRSGKPHAEFNLPGY